MLNETKVGLICLSERKRFKEVYEEVFYRFEVFRHALREGRGGGL